MNFYLALFGLFIHIIPANATCPISAYLTAATFIAAENNYVQIAHIMFSITIPLLKDLSHIEGVGHSAFSYLVAQVRKRCFGTEAFLSPLKPP